MFRYESNYLSIPAVGIYTVCQEIFTYQTKFAFMKHIHEYGLCALSFFSYNQQKKFISEKMFTLDCKLGKFMNEVLHNTKFLDIYSM